MNFLLEKNNNPNRIMDKINITFEFNNDAVEEPMNYLGGGYKIRVLIYRGVG